MKEQFDDVVLSVVSIESVDVITDSWNGTGNNTGTENPTGEP